MAKEKQQSEGKSDADERVRLTVHIDKELIEKARDYVWWTPGTTLAQLVTEALTEKLKRVEKKLGNEIPMREGQLTSGRPITKRT